MYYFTFLYMWLLYFIKKKTNRSIDFLVLLPFFVLPFLRFGVGADYFSYQYLYENLPITSFERFWSAYPGIEIGFKLLLLVGRKLGLSYHLFIGLLSSILSYFVYRWSKRNSEDLILSMILYYSLFYFAWNLNAIRQGFTIILFFCLVFNKDEMSFQREIIVVLALALFHASILITIPLLYLRKKEIKPIHFMIILVLGVFFSQLPFAKMILPFKSFKYLGKVYKYVDEINYIFFNFATIARLLLFSFILFFYKLTYKDNNEYENSVIKFYLLGLSLYFFLKPIETIASRTSIYGYYLIILIFALVYEYFKKYNYKLLKFGFIIFVFLFTSLGTYKELQGAAIQSGYKYDANGLNFVTIFNYDRFDFYNKFNIIPSIKDSTSTDFESFHETRLDYGKEKQDEEFFIPVSFPDANPRFGIIDNSGNVIEKPKYHSRPPIYGTFIEEFYGDGAYKQKRFRAVGSETYIDETLVHESLLTTQMEIAKFNHFGFNVEEIKYEQVDQEVLKNFIAREDISSMKVYEFDKPQKFQVIEVNTQGYRYLLLSKINDKPVQSKLYYSIEPYRGTDVFLASTEHTLEFINKNGQVIWVEEK